MNKIKNFLKIVSITIFISITFMLFEGCGSCYDCTDISYNLEKENLGKMINSKADDFAPMLINDMTLLFTSNRGGGNDEKITESNKLGEDIYSANKFSNFWQKATLQPIPATSKLNEGSIGRINDYLIIARTYEKEGFGGSDLYEAELNNNNIVNIRNLGERINSSRWEGHPTLSPDGKILIFASDRLGGIGGTDLYICEKTSDGKWSKPINLVKLNTKMNEYSPFISQDGVTLFFASDGRSDTKGGLDIYMTSLSNFTPIKNLDSPINTASNDYFPFLKKNSCMSRFDPLTMDTLFFASDREGGCGGFDLYNSPLAPPKVYVEGIIRDSKTKAPLKINSNVEVVQSNLSYGNAQEVQAPDSRYKDNICMGKYIIKANANNYFPAQVEITAPYNLSDQKIEKDIYLDPFPSVTIFGKVFDTCGILPFESEVELIDNATNNVIQKVTTTDSRFEIKIPYTDKQENYSVRVLAYDYKQVNASSITVPIGKGDVSFEENILVELSPINPAEIPYFVTGFYRLNTSENLTYLKENWNSKYKKLGYIENPDTKIMDKETGETMSYEDFAGEVDEFTNNVKAKIIDTMLVKLDGILAKMDNAKLFIDIYGYVDEREFFGIYPDETAIVDNGKVARKDNISNKKLSMLRAYYTAKYFKDELSSASDQFKSYLDEGKIIIRKFGKGVAEHGFKKKDPGTMMLYATHRHIKIYVYLKDGRDCKTEKK